MVKKTAKKDEKRTANPYAKHRHPVNCVMIQNRLGFCKDFYPYFGFGEKSKHKKEKLAYQKRQKVYRYILQPYLDKYKNESREQLADEIVNKWRQLDFYKSHKKVIDVCYDRYQKACFDNLKAAGINVVRDDFEIHDSDKYTIEDELKNPKHKTGKVKTLHYHNVLAFYGKGPTPSQIAKAFYIYGQNYPNLPEALQLPRSRKYSADNMEAYLVHAKDPSKFQYDPKGVKSIVGLPYTTLYDIKIAGWKRGIAMKKAAQLRKNEKADLLQAQMDITSGRVWRNLEDFSIKNRLLVARNKNKIKDAFDTLATARIQKYSDALENKHTMQKTLVYVSGANSGAGKTAVLKDITGITRELLEIIDKQKYDIQHPSVQHPFDNYNGQPVCQFDEVRGQYFKLAVWLHAQDPWYSNTADARYYDRTYPAPLTVASSADSLLKFGFFMQGTGKGGDTKRAAIDQVMRRTAFVIYADRDNSYSIDYMHNYGDPVGAPAVGEGSNVGKYVLAMTDADRQAFERDREFVKNTGGREPIDFSRYGETLRLQYFTSAKPEEPASWVYYLDGVVPVFNQNEPFQKFANVYLKTSQNIGIFIAVYTLLCMSKSLPDILKAIDEWAEEKHLSVRTKYINHIAVWANWFAYHNFKLPAYNFCAQQGLLIDGKVATPPVLPFRPKEFVDADLKDVENTEFNPIFDDNPDIIDEGAESVPSPKVVF